MGHIFSRTSEQNLKKTIYMKYYRLLWYLKLQHSNVLQAQNIFTDE